MLLVSQRCSYHVCAIDMTVPVPIMRVLLHCVNFELSELFMAALFLPCSFFLPSSFYLLFFPRLISAAVDWMSAILLHMAWP